MCDVALPNKEIAFVYHKEILQQLDHIIPQSMAVSIQEAIFSGDDRYDIELKPKSSRLPGILIEIGLPQSHWL